MRRARAFGLAVWEFIVGDDWRTALGVALALGATALVADTSVSAWWVMPVAVFGLLTLSIRGAALAYLLAHTKPGLERGLEHRLPRAGGPERSV